MVLVRPPYRAQKHQKRAPGVEEGYEDASCRCWWALERSPASGCTCQYVASLQKPRSKDGADTRLLIQPLSTPPPPTYVCPSPLRPRPPSLLPQHLSPPIPLPSHPDFPLFQLTLSYDTTVCNAFHLDVARRDQGACRRAMATRAAFDPALDAEIKQTMSPDTIHVQLDGAERLAVDRPTSFDPVACSTRFSFRLANPGPVFLNASLLYSDFDALKDVHAAEHSRPKPRLLMTPLVPHPLQLSVCKPSCAPHQPFSPHIPPSSTYPQLYTPFLSPCNSSASQQGAFVPASSFDLVYPSSSIQVPISNSRPTTGLYTYVSQGCAWAHDGLRFRDHSSCTRAPSRHLLVGDSHARSLFDVVANRLDGSDEVTLVSAKGSKKRRQIGELGMVSRACERSFPLAIIADCLPRAKEFHWDPHLTTNFTCATLRDTSSITISTVRVRQANGREHPEAKTSSAGHASTIVELSFAFNSRSPPHPHPHLPLHPPLDLRQLNSNRTDTPHDPNVPPSTSQPRLSNGTSYLVVERCS